MRLLDIIYALSTTTISYLHYKSDDENNLKIIADNFWVLAQYQNNIFYNITPKQMRKVKLEVLNGDLTLKNIIDDSKPALLTDIFDEYHYILNEELKLQLISSSSL